MDSINVNNFICHKSVANMIDEEYKRIIRKLQQYGMRPSGSKTTDKMRLHERELQEAQKENMITSKFLTVTKAEQEKIQGKKKTDREENSSVIMENPTIGQEIYGEQMKFAIEMKKKTNNKNKL